jgi:hypothetical protein
MNTGTEYLEYFQSACQAWTCDGVFVEVRLIARPEVDRNKILKASLQVGVFPDVPTVTLRTKKIVVIKQILGPISANDANALLQDATSGKITCDGITYSLPGGPVSYYSKVPTDGEWNYTLNLTCRSDERETQNSMLWSEINSLLRCAETPFDGIADVSSFLGLSNPSTSTEPQIDIYKHAPAELDVARSKFADGELELTFRAMPGLDLKKVSVALRWASVVADRHQAAHLVRWQEPDGIFREGRLTVPKEGVDGALVMLSVGGFPVRRQWVVEGHRARVVREATIQAFDHGWEKLRDSLINNQKDARGFEKSVATLAFLLGFQVAAYTDNEAPDLAFFTQSGRVILVECTLRTSDVRSKMGKLVDRRGVVSDHLSKIGAAASVVCLLVCQSNRERILVEEEELKKASVLLVAQENLNNLLMRVGSKLSADSILDDVLSG